MEKMSASTERSKRTLERLKQANRTLNETQEVAQCSVNELVRHRSILDKNFERVHHTQRQLTTSQNIIYKMKHWWRNL